MKKFMMSIVTLAAVALIAKPTFADDTHHHDKGAREAQEHTAQSTEKVSDHESMMQEAMNKMHDQMEAIKQAKEPAERLRLLQNHNESMRDSIIMMREMMGGMAMGNCHKMHNHSASHAGHSADTATTPKPEQVENPDKASEKLASQLWVCPMHPEVVQDHPGTCPICGMDLVKMEQPGSSKSGHRHMMQGCMMEGDMRGGMMGMMDKHMDMILTLMEQMIEHNNAEMALHK